MSRLTRHPTTTSDSNPLRHDCEAQGCFNRVRRPKIEVFAQCFPRNVQMSDIDAEVEVNGNFLRIEWKSKRVESLRKSGQQILFERLTLTGPHTALVVYGNAETMAITSFDRYANGKLTKNAGHSMDDLMAELVSWAQLVEAK